MSTIHKPKILVAKDIKFAYGQGEHKTPILHGMSLDVYRGEILAIKGPSGSGKTTLLHLLGCLMTMQEGKLFIDDVDVSSLDEDQLTFFRHDKVGFVFQKFFLLARTSVLDNILLATKFPSETAKTSIQLIEKAISIAESLGLEHRLDHTPGELSGGEQQRVAIARALMNSAALLFADEPTGNLDSKSSQNTLNLFKNLNKNGQTIIIITHDDSVAQQAHRIVNVKDGYVESIEDLRPIGSYLESDVVKEENNKQHGQQEEEVHSISSSSQASLTNNDTSSDGASSNNTNSLLSSHDPRSASLPYLKKPTILSSHTKTNYSLKHDQDKEISNEDSAIISFKKPVQEQNFNNNLKNSKLSKGDQNEELYTKPYRPLKYTLKLLFNLSPLASANLFRNKLRTILTMLGIVIGISAMLILVTAGQYARSNIITSFQTLGANSVSMYGFPNNKIKGSDHYRQVFYKFTMLNDINPLKVIFPQIQYVSPDISYSRGSNVSFAGTEVNQDIEFHGVGGDYFRMLSLKLLEGRYLRDIEINRGASSCVIGYDINRQLFAEKNLSAVGSSLTIIPGAGSSSFSCSIVGVLKKQSMALGSNPNYIVYISYKYLQDNVSFFWFKNIFNFQFSTYQASEVLPTSDAVENYFKQKYGATGQFMISPMTTLLNFFGTVLALVTALLALVAAISLIVAGVGVTNMMLASIVERLKEIGLMKALGATNYSIRLLFLLESLFLSVIAGVIGIVLGFVIYEVMIYLVSVFMPGMGSFSIYFVWYAYVISIGSMLIVGILSGLLPAIRAEKIDVVEALTSE